MDQKRSFKEQARQISHQRHTVKPPHNLQTRSHVVLDPNILINGRINPLERDIQFSDTHDDSDMSFMHDYSIQSNCIVNNDRIVGLLTGKWPALLAGGLPEKFTVGIRSPQREPFTNANLRRKISRI